MFATVTKPQLDDPELMFLNAGAYALVLGVMGVSFVTGFFFRKRFWSEIVYKECKCPRDPY